ncbi:HutD family protein [Kitasatospora sp. NPDC052896]|uniref:HutD family protein n=1 Tax=Kitasatospora sp. NPDC052896 TaxID=3364061 RepID=UPI0037C6205D
MPLLRLPAADRSPTRWRNGGGVTREIASAPDGSWRVSLAEIAADGPFSTFPGLARILTVVAGSGLELTVGDEPPVRPAPRTPFAFPGDVPTSARLLGGPVSALNVMSRGFTADVRLVDAGAPVELLPAPGGLLLAVELTGYDAVLATHPGEPGGLPGPAALIALTPPT